ncbi:MAG: hypothetical protein LBQ28_06835 [Prevotellaceae bacterium]|jgi:hypothetical protein|nr:hypothetical protein [Prevotellaceae bacterium]
MLNRVTKILTAYFETKIWFAFAAIMLVYFVALTLEFKFVFTDDFYLNSLSTRYDDHSKLFEFIRSDRALEWTNYFIAFAIVGVPALLIAFTLNVGTLFCEYKIKFAKLFNIALKAQIIFALNYLVSIILKCTGIIETNWDMIDNNYFYQSAAYFFKGNGYPFWIMYPLQIINITEIVHLLILAFGFSCISKFGYLKSLGFVALFYGIAMIVWIIFTVFLQTLFTT